MTANGSIIKKRGLALIGSIAIAVIGIAIFSFFLLWGQSNENEKADQIVEEALTRYAAAVDAIDNARASAAAAVLACSYEEGGSEVMSLEGIDKSRAEINEAVNFLASAKKEIAAYDSELEPASSLELSREYHTYLSKRRTAGNSLQASITGLEDLLSKMPRILDSYASGQQVFQPQLAADVNQQEYFDELMKKINAEKALFAAEAELFNLQVLSKEHVDINQFYISCNNQLTTYANAVNAAEYDRIDPIFYEYMEQCNDDSYAGANKKRQETWNGSLQNYFSSLIGRFDEVLNEAASMYEESNGYYNSAVL